MYAIRSYYEIVSLACQRIRPRDLTRLRAHLEREQQALASQDKHALIRATGEFHLILAEIAGNDLFLDFLRQLTALSSLILDKFQTEQVDCCDGGHHRITSYNVCYTKLLRVAGRAVAQVP